MLSLEDARKLGINACIDKLGRNFVMKYRDSSTSAYGTESDDDDNLFCFVGVDNKSASSLNGSDVIILDNTTKFPFRVSCNVNLKYGTTCFIECVLPSYS